MCGIPQLAAGIPRLEPKPTGVIGHIANAQIRMGQEPSWRPQNILTTADVTRSVVKRRFKNLAREIIQEPKSADKHHQVCRLGNLVSVPEAARRHAAVSDVTRPLTDQGFPHGRLLTRDSLPSLPFISQLVAYVGEDWAALSVADVGITWESSDSPGAFEARQLANILLP